MTAIKQIFLTLLLLPDVCFAADTLITSWASGHGWTRPDGTATVTDDTSVYYTGAQSLKVVSGGDGAINKIRKVSISPTINMSSKFFKVVLRVSDWSKLDTLNIYTSSDSFNTVYKCEILASGQKYPANEWVTITVPWSLCTNDEGTPVRTAINIFQFYMIDTGSAVTVNFGALYVTDFPSSGYVSFMFDDGYVEHSTLAAPKLAEYGYAGTAFLIWEYSGLWGTYASTAQAQELRSLYGWDIGLHSDTNWTTLSLGGLQSEIWTSRDVFRIRSWNDFARIAAYPFGAVNATVLSGLASTGVDYARTTIDVNETIPPQSPIMIREVMIGNITSVNTIKSRIDTGMTNKEWVILTYHELKTPADTFEKTTPANFNTIVDYVASKQYPVRTFSQMRSVVNALNEGLGPFTYTSKCGGKREEFLSATSRNDFIIPKRINNSTNCQRN